MEIKLRAIDQENFSLSTKPEAVEKTKAELKTAKAITFTILKSTKTTVEIFVNLFANPSGYLKLTKDFHGKNYKWRLGTSDVDGVRHYDRFILSKSQPVSFLLKYLLVDFISDLPDVQVIMIYNNLDIHKEDFDGIKFDILKGL